MFGIGCSERVQIGNYIRIKKKAIYIRGFQEFILDILMSKLNIPMAGNNAAMHSSE